MKGIREVAREAGVSISTVSNVLNGTKYVSPELKLRVEEAVRKLAYQADPAARGMRTTSSGLIGVITEDLCGMFYPYVLRGISEVASEAGFQVIMCDAKSAYGENGALDREKELFRQLVNSRTDGIIFVSTVSDEEKKAYVSEIREITGRYKKTALVSIERDFSDEGIDSVYFDGKKNAAMATEHLIECGCRKIVHITGPDGFAVAKERIDGFLETLEKNHMEYDRNKVIAEGDYTHPGGYRAMKELLLKAPDLDGVFCANDQSAIGALRCLAEAGKRVPQDVRVIGYDDVFISGVMDPPLSTVHIQKVHAGRKAAELLIRRIREKDEEKEADKAPEKILMNARLAVRKSTSEEAREDWMQTDLW